MEVKTPAFGHNTRGVVTPLMVGALLLSAVFLQVGIDNERTRLGLTTTRVKSTASTTLEFLGGLRATAAALLWIKVDRLHDSYYGQLSKEEDELIPLYRLVTWLDPHIYQAYYVGSYMLYLVDRPDEGWDFALEGLRMNPESSRMEFNVGHLALVYRNDYKDAISHLERAYSLAQDDEDKFYALSNLKVAYRKAGMTDKAEAAEAELAIIEENARNIMSENQDHVHGSGCDHDHDDD
ncbi:MAG: tetratricopeptide repeat protein [Actinobacteria bacterium]|nr:tetratricopeptide repeat protein [Actinomycetota bacterium]